MKHNTLNNGASIPSIGLGTYRLSAEEAEHSVMFALNSGYRLIDTANLYFNEEAVGRGIKKSGVPREEIFLTSKIYPTRYKDIAFAIDETLERLDADYLDLLLLHRPYGDYVGAYKKIVAEMKKGIVRSVGVSAFSLEEIKRCIEATGVTPVINQIECNPFAARIETQKAMEKLGVAVESFSPFGGGDQKLLQHPYLADLGRKYSKTPAQIILRYLLQRNIIVIPGSKSEAHIRENLGSVFFALTESEMKCISFLSKGEGHKEPLMRFFYRFMPRKYYEKKK